MHTTSRACPSRVPCHVCVSPAFTFPPPRLPSPSRLRHPARQSPPFSLSLLSPLPFLSPPPFFLSPRPHPISNPLPPLSPCSLSLAISVPVSLRTHYRSTGTLSQYRTGVRPCDARCSYRASGSGVEGLGLRSRVYSGSGVWGLGSRV
eukprot:2724279-Rhodomonas_salina.2